MRARTVEKNLSDEVLALKRFKERSGWSCDRIGIKLEVSGQAVRNWFKGRAVPSRLSRKSINEFLISIPKSIPPGGSPY